MNFPFIALKQHFPDSSGGTEIAVNLKWRMGVEHVRKGTVAQQALKQHMRMVAVQQPRP